MRRIENHSMSQIQSLIDRENAFDEEIRQLKAEYQVKREELVSEYEDRISQLQNQLNQKEDIIASEVSKRVQDTSSEEQKQPKSINESHIHKIIRDTITET